MYRIIKIQTKVVIKGISIIWHDLFALSKRYGYFHNQKTSRNTDAFFLLFGFLLPFRQDTFPGGLPVEAHPHKKALSYLQFRI